MFDLNKLLLSDSYKHRAFVMLQNTVRAGGFDVLYAPNMAVHKAFLEQMTQFLTWVSLSDPTPEQKSEDALDLEHRDRHLSNNPAFPEDLDESLQEYAIQMTRDYGLKLEDPGRAATAFRINARQLVVDALSGEQKERESDEKRASRFVQQRADSVLKNLQAIKRLALHRFTEMPHVSTPHALQAIVENVVKGVLLRMGADIHNDVKEQDNAQEELTMIHLAWNRFFAATQGVTNQMDIGMTRSAFGVVARELVDATLMRATYPNSVLCSTNDGRTVRPLEPERTDTILQTRAGEVRRDAGRLIEDALREYHARVTQRMADPALAFRAVCETLVTQVLRRMGTTPTVTNAGLEDELESSFWNMDARVKGYNEWRLNPQSQRDAFKAVARLLLTKLGTIKIVEQPSGVDSPVTEIDFGLIEKELLASSLGKKEASPHAIYFGWDCMEYQPIMNPKSEFRFESACGADSVDDKVDDAPSEQPPSDEDKDEGT